MVLPVFDKSEVENVYIHKYNVEQDVQTILGDCKVLSDENIAAWLLKVVTVIDLTTLAGDDTRVNVTRLCMKAASPLSAKVCEKLQLDFPITTAAVCVYPSRVADAYEALNRMDMIGKVNIASVATGFPTGLYPLETRIQEIKYSISQGANEIDVVIDRSLVLGGKWKALYEEVVQMRKACGTAHLKVILGVGELGSLNNVYKASMISMMAGADFIKTSTGKEVVNATLPVGLVMCRAIRNFHSMTGKKVGLKPAGGIKTWRDAINWLVLVHSELGADWLSPTLFRIGASSLLGGIEHKLHCYVLGEVGAERFAFI